MTISEAMNLWPAVLATLADSGYSLQIEFDDDDECSAWLAVRGETKLSASNPVALLGLAALVEARGDRWDTAPEERGILARLLDGEVVEPSHGR